MTLATPLLNSHSRQSAARAFAEKWAGRGYEKGDTASFWLELLSKVLGMEDVTSITNFEERAESKGFIDLHITEAKTVVEQKSLGIDLDKPELRQKRLVTPYQQAKRYVDSLPNLYRPDFIIVCNFETFRIHDLNVIGNEQTYLEFSLSELEYQYHLLDFLLDPQRKRAAKEKEVSINAGELISKLYHLLEQQFDIPELPQNQHALNVLCVRLVFCLFAEDAGLFPKDALFDYLQEAPASQTRLMIKELFRVLDTKPENRDKYLDAKLKAFPYVNGGLFRGEEEVPPFTEEILTLLTTEISRDTNWSQISPTIFGGVFESTLNPETRRTGGMHYTSPANIHKVIDPLFMDDLQREFLEIVTKDGQSLKWRIAKLERLHDKIASLQFFDPACGSGNFLTETYLSLRKLENQIIAFTMNNQTQLVVGGESPLKVSINQFHGLEINDFAVSVATTALWIAQIQANIEAQQIIEQYVEDLPLHDAANIAQGNALTTDWDSVLPAERCDYIVGNPPFLGARNQSKEQKAELVDVFPPGTKNVGNIDYVAGWFMKAADYAKDNPIDIAFVATNSICQGEQVANVWYPIMQLGFHINFAHNTFRWANEATDQASVFCSIIGFSKQDRPVKLYHYSTPDAAPELRKPSRLNAYLSDAPDVFVWSRKKPISPVPAIGIGNKPIDGGNYIFTPEEKNDFLQREPNAAQYMHPFLGSREFINAGMRYILWLGEANPADLARMPLVMERIRAVKEYRETSKSAPTRKIANIPTHYHVENIPKGNSLVIPRVSSQSRKYLPMGLIPPDDFCSDAILLMANAELFHLGILQSLCHNAWLRAVGGRLKSDYRYSGGIVYNSFVWPEATVSEKSRIEQLAQVVVDARAKYPGSSLADLYNPDNEFLYPELMAAHAALDRAVEQLYGLDLNGLNDQDREEHIVAHLFSLYQQKVAAEKA